MTPNENRIAKAIENTLISPNEADSNLEAANVVDGLYFLARHIRNGLLWVGAGDRPASPPAIEAFERTLNDASTRIADALDNVATAIREQKEK